MNFYDFAPVAAVLHTAYSGVSIITDLFTPIAGSLASALAIVLLTLVVRAALIPVGRSQVRAEVARRRIAPKLKKLQERYKTNPPLLQRKTLEMYATEKVSPMAGILPTLLQTPVLSVVYGLFTQLDIRGTTNTLLSHDLFGANLGTALIAGVGWPDPLVYAVLLALIATVAVVGRRGNLRFSGTAALTGPMATTSAVLSWMPLVTVVFAAIVPLAATIYLAVTTTWTVAERAILRARYTPDAIGHAIPA